MKFMKMFYVCLVVLFVLTQSFSMPSANEQRVIENQDIIEEKRPFDFSEDYYIRNGVNPRLLLNRRTGTDGYSVVDFINSEIHRNIRVIGTLPAYDQDGKTLYWSLFGELFKETFTEDKLGEEAYEIANRFPIYTFPSTTHKNSDRQAVIFETGDSYFEKNPIGLGVVVLVEYTKRISTKEGQETLTKLAERNGLTLDGTPMIHTTNEIADLTRKGLVTQKIRGIDDKNEPSFAIAKVLQKPTMGAISPDAFLETVLKDNGKPLDAERFFVENFECLQKTGRWCAE